MISLLYSDSFVFLFLWQYTHATTSFTTKLYSRTFKDVITFIPVVIILIIPLSPVGHVLVFGAIQRFFPDFFPSCFTEQRQNLLQLYETTEFSEVTIKENLQARLTRFLEALTFFIANKSREVYRRLTNTYTEDTDDTKVDSS